MHLSIDFCPLKMEYLWQRLRTAKFYEYKYKCLKAIEGMATEQNNSQLVKG